ncbi:hypothetical protein EDB81DRAFT_887440 [Dactylonectria macrodidyma]|uniref:Uncharacterized protein n=1 Tax=Dactylonectria macrodidyma TaxID=307937 RepID=A0A9P9IWJ8_9HYPO|nr:hypothetical protein EDB81DRAFT_887440 [Dactylonectria macrodidyma]
MGQTIPGRQEGSLLPTRPTKLEQARTPRKVEDQKHVTFADEKAIKEKGPYEREEHEPQYSVFRYSVFDLLMFAAFFLLACMGFGVWMVTCWLIFNFFRV